MSYALVCLPAPSPQVVLLLNKADLLTRPQRLSWARFFQRAGLRFIFFSAGLALQEAEREKQRLKRLTPPSTDTPLLVTVSSLWLAHEG